MGKVHSVGLNKAVIVSGGCLNPTKKIAISGSWIWTWWCISNVQTLCLEVMIIETVCQRAETVKGVPITVTGMAHVKIIRDIDLLFLAAEHFLGKPENDIKSCVMPILEGHLRAVLSTMTLEEILRNQCKLAAQVSAEACSDLANMGIQILYFTIKNILDEIGYLSSLGVLHTTLAKRDAHMDAVSFVTAEQLGASLAQKATMKAKYETEIMLENEKKKHMLQKAEYQRQISTINAYADIAYELEVAKLKQKIRKAEIEIQSFEGRQQVKIANLEAKKKELEMVATVKLEAIAEAYQIQTIAEGRKTLIVENGRAEAQRVKLQGLAMAKSIELIGNAEAEALRIKAKAYQNYGVEALLSTILETLGPSIAKELTVLIENAERKSTQLKGNFSTLTGSGQIFKTKEEK